MLPQQQARAFTVATDDVIASMINGAIERLVVVAPAVWPQVATAICERWRVLGSQGVTVVLDSDPEAYRLGYGELAALQELQQTATEVGAEIHHQPGLRIGVVIADNKTLIYTPTAKLVEAGQNTHANTATITSRCCRVFTVCPLISFQEFQSVRPLLLF